MYTREDGQPAQVRIADEIASFEVTGLTAPESVNVGDEVTVSATVSNPNDFAIEQPVQFRFDGDLVEIRNVEIDAESSTDVQFEIRATGPPGTYIHSVFTNDFGQDAIITVETPGQGPPTDGDDSEDGADGTDDADDEDSEDGNGVDGEDGADGEDTEEDGSAGNDSDEEQPETPEDA